MSQPQQPQKPKSLVERVADLEASLASIQQLAILTSNLRDAFAMEVETLDSAIEVLGIQEQVTAKLAEKRETARKARNERAKKVLEQLLKTKQIEAVETVDEDSILVGNETNSQGDTTNDYVQTTYANLVDEAKKQVLGQKVGFVLEHNGTKLEIQGIYHMVSPAQQEPALSEVQAAAPAADVAITETAPLTPPSNS